MEPSDHDRVDGALAVGEVVEPPACELCEATLRGWLGLLVADSALVILLIK